MPWLPHPSLIPALCCVISYGELLSLYPRLHPEARGASEAVLQLQEPRELILYFTLFTFLLMAFSALRKGADGPPLPADPRKPLNTT